MNLFKISDKIVYNNLKNIKPLKKETLKNIVFLHKKSQFFLNKKLRYNN